MFYFVCVWLCLVLLEGFVEILIHATDHFEASVVVAFPYIPHWVHAYELFERYTQSLCEESDFSSFCPQACIRWWVHAGARTAQSVATPWRQDWRLAAGTESSSHGTGDADCFVWFLFFSPWTESQHLERLHVWKTFHSFVIISVICAWIWEFMLEHSW